MKTWQDDRRDTFYPPLSIGVAALLFILAVGLACALPGSDDGLKQTQDALNIQGTQLALQQTQIAQSKEEQQPQEELSGQRATLAIQATQVALQATQMAMNIEATANAQAPTNTPEPTQAQPPADNQPPPSASGLPDFDTWMRSANILLYEDMAGQFTVYRFIKMALDNMGLPYSDVKDALGNYKNALLSGGPGGKGWDLIISGKELRSNVSGEFYVYLNDALNQGSSVIIEEWDIDAIASGTISNILSRCGVEFQADWYEENLNLHLLYPVNGTHPIHHTPNEGISLTNPSGYWQWTDLGDWLRLRPGSSAKLLWSARSNVRDAYGTAVVCVDDRLIIQTYSSHSYGQERVIMMWQNYIYNALKARYDYLAAHP